MHLSIPLPDIEIEVEWKIYGIYKISLPYPTSKSFLCIHRTHSSQMITKEDSKIKYQNRDEHVKRLCKFHCPYCRTLRPHLYTLRLALYACTCSSHSLTTMSSQSELNVNIPLLGQLHTSDWHSFYFISVVSVQLLCVQKREKKRIENIVALPFHLLL